MNRKLIIAGAVALALAATGTVFAVRAVHAGPGNPAFIGMTAGTSKATNNVAACSQIGGSGGLCDVTMKGNYFAQALPGVNNGTYKATVVIDWSTYAFDSNFNENCAQVGSGGTMTFTSGSSTLKATIGNGAVCEETQPSPVVRDYFLNSGTITQATGIWKHINKASDQIGIQGSSWEFTNTTGSYLDQGFFNNTNLS